LNKENVDVMKACAAEFDVQKFKPIKCERSSPFEMEDLKTCLSICNTCL